LEYIQRTLLKVLIEEKEYAEEKQIDLIVMGTRGKKGFKKLLLGVLLLQQ
jgi:nucleotide-binding universal stress UspA family protein